MVKLFIIIALLPWLTGCVGLAAGTYGTFQAIDTSPNIGSSKNQFSYAPQAQPLTKAQLLSSWGTPDETYQSGSCEVLSYYDGYTWSGFGVFLGILPIPLLVPSGHDENRFYFKNGTTVAVVKEYGEVVSAYGYLCGSNQCGAVFGPVNTQLVREQSLAECND